MSADGRLITEVEAALVSDLAVEPSYISEIARKMQISEYPFGVNRETVMSDALLDTTWDDVQESTAIRRVAKIAFMLNESEPERYELVDVDYDTGESTELDQNQSQGSMHLSFSELGFTEEDEWRQYRILHNVETDFEDIGSLWEEAGRLGFKKRLEMDVDPSITIGQKEDVVRLLSRSGNNMSKFAEEILQDVFDRQFSQYETQQTPVEIFQSDYNDPGEDFYFEDIEQERGIQIEVSTRYENPIGQPYIDTKIDRADELEQERDVAVDLLILAPKFTQSVLDKYGEMDRVVLVEVPNDGIPRGSRFAFKEEVPEGGPGDGYPIIAPDGSVTRQRLLEKGHIADGYPVVDEFDSDFMEAIEAVNRNSEVVLESRYRNMLREGSEPLLPEFRFPYRIEQYLLDFYWDKGLTQKEIGELTDTSDRTISEWMNEQHWDIVTRGVQTPLTDETIQIWVDMYEGNDPFPRQMTGFEVKALYDSHPNFTMEDWEDWFESDAEMRQDQIVMNFSREQDVTYTIMLGADSRLFPSYSFVIETLRRQGVEIREGVFSSGQVIATGLARQFMLNTERIQERTGDEVLYLRSDLENQMAEWLSDNEIPFAYELVNIPGAFIDNEEWNEKVEMIQNKEGGSLGIWEDIYDKHRLDEEGDVGVEEGLERFDKKEIVTDFAIYGDKGVMDVPLEWDGWDEWTHLVELAGPYGAGKFPEAAPWEDWYRVNSVAYKELMFKMLGIWDDIVFVIPNSGQIDQEVRDDPNYVIVQSSQADAGLDVFGFELGLI